MDTLIDNCLRGDKTAWDAFVTRYAPVIHAAIRRVFPSGSPSPDVSIEDLVQQVFVRLIQDDYRLLRSFDPARASAATWLTIIARSVAIDRLRLRRLSTVPLDAVAPPASRAQPPPEPPTEGLPQDILTAREKLVLHLLYDREMSFEEIAELTGVAVQTVRSAKHKAILKLREYYGSRESE